MIIDHLTELFSKIISEKINPADKMRDIKNYLQDFPFIFYSENSKKS